MPLPDFALNGNRAAGAVHDAVDDREAEPRSLPDRLRGEERIEDAVEVVGADAAAVVAHGESRVLPWRQLREPRRSASAGPMAIVARSISMSPPARVPIACAAFVAGFTTT